MRRRPHKIITRNSEAVSSAPLRVEDSPPTCRLLEGGQTFAQCFLTSVSCGIFQQHLVPAAAAAAD